MSKSQPQCELEPEILAKSFFPEESLLPDPEIFNVLEKILDPADLSHFSKNYKYSYFYSGKIAQCFSVKINIGENRVKMSI